MIILLSPSKGMDFSATKVVPAPTTPLFQHEADRILSELKNCSKEALAKFLKCSPKIAEQCHNFYHKPQPKQAAIYSYSGDVYSTLQAADFNKNELEFAQKHIIILSALYGVVRPYDTIQPYRLDFMGQFTIDAQNLYRFWTEKVEAYFKDLNEKVVINLASTEYARLIKNYKSTCQFITPNFYDWKTDKFKIISSFAKKARGAMANWIIKNQITDRAALVNFNAMGYQYNDALSQPFSPIFTRK